MNSTSNNLFYLYITCISCVVYSSSVTRLSCPEVKFCNNPAVSRDECKFKVSTTSVLRGFGEIISKALYHSFIILRLYHLEEMGLLDPLRLDPVQLFCLHYVYLPLINKSLKHFQGKLFPSPCMSEQLESNSQLHGSSWSSERIC